MPDERKQNGIFCDKDRQRSQLLPIGAQESIILMEHIKRVADEMEQKIKRIEISVDSVYVDVVSLS